MKHYITLTIFVYLISCSQLFAQTFEGNVSLQTQEEVNGFNYTVINGSLTISGDDINDLSPLSILTSVSDYISIRDNPALLEVNNFNNLTNLGTGLYIYNNINLVSFSGFNALTATGDNIDFWYNDSLESVTGFELLETVGWSLEFGGNPVLISIPDFPALQTINSSLFILDNVSLPAITGFSALQYVDWSFDILWNSELKSLCGFYNYFTANNPYTGGGSFNISENHPDLGVSTSIQDILDAGPCSVPAEQQISDLIAYITGLDLTVGITTKLNNSLDKTLRILEVDDTERALLELQKNIEYIEGLVVRGKLDEAIATELTAGINAIIAALT